MRIACVDKSASARIELGKLIERAYEHFGVVPTLLERDFNIPPLPELLAEVDRIAELQARHGGNIDAESARGHTT